VTELLLLALVGGVVAVDGVAAVQSMLSRPLVVGWAVGMLVGTPVLGAQIGVLLELYLLVAIPSGGGRYPEGGTATVVAVVAAAAAVPSPGALGVGIAGGLAWGWVAATTQSALRRWNERRADAPDHHLDAREVARAQAAGLGLDFARGVVLTAIGVVAARWIAPVSVAGWPVDQGATFSLVALGALVSLGTLLRGVAGTRGRAVLFGVGLAAGALLLSGAA
jgi:mannose/fructose/N-acetylgalactosamine-specific phosphotransferase system component IIC